MRLRGVFNPDMAMEKDNYHDLFNGAECARVITYLLCQWETVGVKAYTKASLRDDMCRELKALRVKTGKKEQETLHQPFLEEVLKIIWDR